MENIPDRFSDITIVVEGKEYKLHKLVLVGLPYFDKLFTENFQEKGVNVIKFDDLEIKPFESLIGQLYSQRLKKEGRDYKFTNDDIGTAKFFGLEKQIDNYLDSIKWHLGKDMRNSKLYNKIWDENFIEDSELFLANYDKPVDEFFIYTEVIDLERKEKKIDLMKYPFTFVHYMSLKKMHGEEYDKDVDLTDIYNLIFDENVKDINADKVYDRYIKEKIKKNTLKYYPTLTPKGVEEFQKEVSQYKRLPAAQNEIAKEFVKTGRLDLFKNSVAGLNLGKYLLNEVRGTTRYFPDRLITEGVSNLHSEDEEEAAELMKALKNAHLQDKVAEDFQ